MGRAMDVFMLSDTGENRASADPMFKSASPDTYAVRTYKTGQSSKPKTTNNLD